MKRTFIKKGFLACIITLLATASSFAQTINTGAVTPTAVCAGSDVSVAFTSSSAFPVGNVFKVELSDDQGNFSGNLLTTNSTASPLIVKIPTNTVAGSEYKLRIISSDPAIMGSESGNVTIKSTPEPPYGGTYPGFCVGDNNASLPVPNTPGTTYTWYALDMTTPLVGTPSIITSYPLMGQRFNYSQTVNDCESGKSTITVNVQALAAKPTVTKSPVVCQNTVVGSEILRDAITINPGASLVWYESESGNGSSTIPIVSTATAGSKDYYVTQQYASVCQSQKAKVTVTVTAAPIPPVVVNRSYTVGQTGVPVLSATGTGSLIWFTQEIGGVGVSTPPTLSTSIAGTTSYWVTQTVDGCESARARLDVVVSAVQCTPSPTPTIVQPAAICQNNTLINTTTILSQSITSTGSNYKWYASANATSFTTTIPSTSVLTPGSFDYYVTQTNSGQCESPKAKVTITVRPAPTPPGVTNRNYTVGQTNIPALTATGTGTFFWFMQEVSGNSLPAAPIPSTATPGTTSYWVTQTINSCESPRAKLDVIVTTPACPPSATPTIAATFSYCASTTPATALVATGTAIKWYSSTNVLLTAPPVPVVNVSATTITKYFVTQTESGKCESAKKEVTVTVYKTLAPGVSADVKEYCLNETAVALTATGTDLKWYNSTTGTTTVPATPITTTAGNQIFYVSQTLNTCESERARVDVKVKPLPAAPTVTALAPVCQNGTVASSVLLAAVTPKTGLSWYTAATGGTGTPTAPVVVTTASGIKNYYVAQTVNGCESAARATLALDIKALPTAPIVVTPVAYCKDVTVPTALTAPGTALKWYNVATNGTASTTAPVPVTTAVGTIPYYVSQTATYTGSTLTCESPRAKLDVVTNPLPAAPTAIVEALCQEKEEKTFTFPSKPTTGNSIVWYTAATGTGIALPTVSLKTPGETTIYSVQKTMATGCESPTRTVNKIRVKALPTLPVISTPLVEYCQFVGAAPLSATALSGASLNWYGTSATGGNSSSTAPTPSTAEGGTLSYYVAQTLEGCLGDRAKIDVKINTTPKPVTQTYLAYCQGVVAPTLSATGSALKWYRQATSAESQSNPFIPFTEKVEDYSFFVTQTGANTCESPKEEIKIHIKALPSATISGSKEVSLGEQATLSLAFTGDGPWKYILSSGDTGNASQSPATVNVTPATTTTYFVTEVSNECGKGSPIGSAQITVKVPTIITGSPSVAEACAGTSFTVPFQQSGDFPAGNTFKVQIAQVNEDAAFYSIPSVPGLNTIVATFPDTTKGGSYFVRVVNSGANPAFTAKGSVNTVGIAAIPLPVATVTGTQTVLIGSPATLKVDITGKGPWSFTLTDGTKDSVITAPTSPYSFLITPKVTSTYTIKTVSNSCGVGRGAGFARVQVDPILGVEPPVTDWLKVYPTVTNAECTVEITTTIANKDARIQILDLKGRPVHEQIIRQKSTQLDFTKYPAGLYLIQIQNGNLRSVNRVMKP